MRAFAVALVLVLAARCSPDPAPVVVDDGMPPAVYVTAPPATDPPFVADAAGVPQPAAGDAATGDGADVALDATTSPAAPIVPGPDGTSVAGRCTQYEILLYLFAPPQGWDAGRMSRYMWRESRCTPTVRSRTRDSGSLQINDVNLPFLRTALGEWVDRYTLLDPVQNVRAAAALCTYWRNAGHSCYAPWGSR